MEGKRRVERRKEGGKAKRQRKVSEAQGGSAAQLVEHGACNARIVDSIPTGDQWVHVSTHYCKYLWIRVSLKLLTCTVHVVG